MKKHREIREDRTVKISLVIELFLSVATRLPENERNRARDCGNAVGNNFNERDTIRQAHRSIIYLGDNIIANVYIPLLFVWAVIKMVGQI